ncbi:hypothetical protein fugu_015133 [Takifugu bimaculatus]|uniref:Uncharacterized protein n=1 Tax=Takifugu bimaculatus TaxID=433685 RepID=A0A4Z2BYG9_9TELE|nr:hypothetical protein fugu_015133 [Takifugu bimaculatus]
MYFDCFNWVFSFLHPGLIAQIYIVISDRFSSVKQVTASRAESIQSRFLSGRTVRSSGVNVAMVPAKKQAGINLCSTVLSLAGFDSQNEIVLKYLQFDFRKKKIEVLHASFGIVESPL